MGGSTRDSWLGSMPFQDNNSEADSIIRQSCTQAVGDFFSTLMNVFRQRFGCAATFKITFLYFMSACG